MHRSHGHAATNVEDEVADDDVKSPQHESTTAAALSFDAMISPILCMSADARSDTASARAAGNRASHTNGIATWESEEGNGEADDEADATTVRAAVIRAWTHCCRSDTASANPDVKVGGDAAAGVDDEEDAVAVDANDAKLRQCERSSEHVSTAIRR